MAAVFDQTLLDSKTVGSRYTVTISCSGHHDLRIASSSFSTVNTIRDWYQDLTKEKVSMDKKAKYTNAILFVNARKDKIFGEDWVSIVCDFMLSLDFELMGDGAYFNCNNSKINKNLLFVSANKEQSYITNDMK